MDRPGLRGVTGHGALVQFSTRSGNQSTIDAIGTTSLGTAQPSHPDGFTYLQPPPGASFSSKVSIRRRSHIAAHSEASTAPRIDASLNSAATAREINRIQTKLNHPAGLKSAASKHRPTLTCPISPASGAAIANPKISRGQPHEIPREDS